MCRAKDKELHNIANRDTLKSLRSFFIVLARLLTHNTLLQTDAKHLMKIDSDNPRSRDPDLRERDHKVRVNAFA